MQLQWNVSATQHTAKGWRPETLTTPNEMGFLGAVSIKGGKSGTLLTSLQRPPSPYQDSLRGQFPTP